MDEPEEHGAVEVEAAGCVVWRAAGDGVQVLVVHRPSHQDWSFPKGKLEPAESPLDGAVREVLEETGMTGVIGPALAEARYADRHGRAKRVRYWAMRADEGARFVANDEVDEAEWLGLVGAVARLSYPHDRQLVEDFRRKVVDPGRPRTTPH